MDAALLRISGSWWGQLARVALAVAVASAVATGCTQATCADYHAPGCWTPPPPDDAGDAMTSGDVESSDAATGSDAASDAAASSDGPATDALDAAGGADADAP
jgi:hypothetical protein